MMIRGDWIEVVKTNRGIQEGLWGLTGTVMAVDKDDNSILIRYDEDLQKLRTPMPSKYYWDSWRVKIKQEDLKYYSHYRLLPHMVKIIQSRWDTVKPEKKEVEPSKPIKEVDQYQVLADIFYGE